MHIHSPRGKEIREEEKDVSAFARFFFHLCFCDRTLAFRQDTGGGTMEGCCKQNWNALCSFEKMIGWLHTTFQKNFLLGHLETILISIRFSEISANVCQHQMFTSRFICKRFAQAELNVPFCFELCLRNHQCYFCAVTFQSDVSSCLSQNKLRETFRRCVGGFGAHKLQLI